MTIPCYDDYIKIAEKIRSLEETLTTMKPAIIEDLKVNGGKVVVNDKTFILCEKKDWTFTPDTMKLMLDAEKLKGQVKTAQDFEIKHGQAIENVEKKSTFFQMRGK